MRSRLTFEIARVRDDDRAGLLKPIERAHDYRDCDGSKSRDDGLLFSTGDGEM